MLRPEKVWAIVAEISEAPRISAIYDYSSSCPQFYLQIIWAIAVHQMRAGASLQTVQYDFLRALTVPLVLT